MKNRIKQTLLSRLHAVDQQLFDITDRISSRGITEFAKLNYDCLKAEILEYMQSMKVAPYTYKYSASCPKPCLYASVYAVMLEGIIGTLNQRGIHEHNKWGEYLNSFQSKYDGLYYDPNLVGNAYNHLSDWNEGWGKHHLMGHIIIALARLKVTPKYPLKYLEQYYDTNYLLQWMEKFDFSSDIWSASNYFMNLYTVLEYSRDYLNDRRAHISIETIAKWLLKKQNPRTGMWHDQDIEKLDLSTRLNIVRAAYHFYPLFEYEGIKIPYQKEIINFILPLQNSWGGWTLERHNSGACEDIDAIDPLIRYAAAAPEKAAEIKTAVIRSMIWQLSCRNDDKGFSFYVKSAQEYGGHPLTSSLRDESSMFATWFRILCLAYEMSYIGIDNKFDIGHFPGYEIK